MRLSQFVDSRCLLYLILDLPEVYVCFDAEALTFGDLQ